MADIIVYEKNGKTITRAEHSGFCYGVMAALKKTLDTVEECGGSGRKVYTYGQIIHNDDVVRELRQKGVEICGGPGECEADAAVIIRSHGVGRQEEEELRRSCGLLVDATCPHVKKIHHLVSDACDRGSQIVIIGDPEHAEVKGIDGWCGHRALIIEKPQQLSEPEKRDLLAEARREGREIFAVAQTTLNRRTWEECTAALKEICPDVRLQCTICSATANRQDACRRVAEQSDVMIVIGGKNSSNSRKLFDIASEVCEKTYFIENTSFLPLKDIAEYNRIGISAGASAPERIIKEVISNMSEVITNNIEEANGMQDFMAEIEKSLKIPQRGEIVKGEVIQVGPREVYVNVGCKKDGIIPKDEIALEADQDIESLFKLGDVVEAKVLKTDDGDGNILLSRKKVEISEHWNEIIKAYEDKSFVNVKVIREVKGGVIAAYKEVTGFIPMSQLNDRYVEKADEFIGQTLTVKVTRVDQKRNKAVFSHKAYLAEEKSKKIAEIWASLHVGDTVEGTVMRFTDYGAFVDIGGIDGLLHISEISWGKLRHPQEALSIGEKIRVKILSMNEEKGKISLGLKQNTPEPWSVINENYHVGQIVQGKVVQIKEYGAFVELEPGLDGLVHISEIAHKRVTNIADEISVGQIVSAKILEIDEEKRRISLSIKETIDPNAPAEPAKAEAAPAEELAAPAEEAEAPAAEENSADAE